MRSALIPILLNSVPGWVRNAYSVDVLPFLSLAAHYDQDLYWVRGRGQCSIDGIQTCTRAQTVPSYATTASGLLVPFAANTNRRTDLGVLPEQAATNIVLQSNTFNTTWATINSASVTANSATDPTNANNGWLLASASNFAGVQQGLTIVSGTTYTASAFCKAGTTHVVAVEFRDVTSTNIVRVKADLNAGTVTGTAVAGSGALVASGIIPFGNGWYRVWVAGTITSTAGGMAIADNANAPINIDVFGAQLEVGSFPTSYIPTTTVPVARATDFIVHPRNPIGTGNFTMLVSVGGVAVQTGKFPTLLSVNDGSGINETQIYAANGGNTANGKEQTSNVSRYDTTIPISITSGAGKIAMTLNGTAARGASNGGNVTALGTWTPTAAFTQMQIGTDNGGVNNPLNGYVKRVAIFQAGMTDAQMQAVTT